MSRPSTAVRVWEVPGLPGRPVRLHPPGAGADGRSKASWRVTFYAADGRPRERTAVGEEAAVRRAESLVQALAAEIRAPSARSTIADLADEYMTAFADSRDWAHKYRRERRQAYRWLDAGFRSLACHEWTKRHSEEVLRAVAAAGYPRGCEEYRRVGSLLSGLRTAGRMYGYLARDQDPMQDVRYNPTSRSRRQDKDVPRDRHPNVRPVGEAEIPGAEQVRLLAARTALITDCWWEELRVLLLAASGMRFGEHADLRTGNVNADPLDPWVRVRRQAVEVYPAPVAGGPTLLVDQPPKFGICRYAFYDPAVVPLLVRRLEEIAADGAPCDDPDGHVLLPTPGGSVVRSGNYHRRVWGRAAADLGWARVEDLEGRPGGAKASGWLWTPHSLRHLYATHLIRDLSVEYWHVAEWMGHSDSSVTEKMYVDKSTPNVGAGVRALARAGT